MSHHPETEMLCPNCGHVASLNYCAQCGQPTHLHKETTWGLVMHFVGHYFHYDSKFWQTLKTLAFKPGTLTVAYWKQQRARFIPPISMYIFISTIYFLLAYMAMPNTLKAVDQNKFLRLADSAAKHRATIVTKKDPVTGKMITTTTVRPRAVSMKERNEVVEKIMHHMPKVYFFMVPFLALILKLLFYKRKELYFVDHVIYSLHFHSLGFLILSVPEIGKLLLPPMFLFSMFLALLGWVALFIYSVLGLQESYQISAGRSIAYTVLAGTLYYIAAIAILLGIVVYCFPEVLSIR